ncbi:steroid receptor RNA activator 1-like [Danaus plexippus]|uniref:steroid receptor RNA activator 1-like n=1 Tax=Danaus plexippus TaxID=13037 RepID=UPI002AB1848D|nr:steroid receptor RNA activator 1-like [Danaus plexippus]XP_061382655.1 steroid receptor RNA activator 1-like [Danaus plexippus]
MENCDSSPAPSKVSYDPGWNDPPSFAYNAQNTAPNRPRNILNKRVAFPLSGNATNSIPPPSINLPPMPSSLELQTLTQNIVPETKSDEHIELDSESTLKEVKDILLQLLESSSELGPKSESIKKKIATMEDMWRNNKLTKLVQLRMRDLAYALRDDTPKKADDIHKALMVDHVSAVCAWMPGVKQLIYHCIARSELLAIDKE